MPKQKKGNLFKNLTVIFGIVFVFLCGIMAFWLWQKFSHTSSSTIPTTKEASLPTGWNRYTSKSQKFRIGYPANKKVFIKENDPYMGICSIEVSDVQFRIYPKDYPHLVNGLEPEFGGDVLVSVVGVNNETGISLENWIRTYCTNPGEEWILKNLQPFQSQTGTSVKSYSKEYGKDMLVGLDQGEDLYFLYVRSFKQDQTPEEIFSQMLNTFQTKD